MKELFSNTSNSKSAFNRLKQNADLKLHEKIVVFIVANILLLMFRENSFSENERHHSKDWRPIKENEQ